MLKWPPLRDVGVPAGSLEIRVWMYKSFESVYRLTRHEGEWTGFYATRYDQHFIFTHYGEDGVWTTELASEKINDTVPIIKLTPRTGWANLWKKLETLEILTLPEVPFRLAGNSKIHFLSAS